MLQYSKINFDKLQIYIFDHFHNCLVTMGEIQHVTGKQFSMSTTILNQDVLRMAYHFEANEN